MKLKVTSKPALVFSCALAAVCSTSAVLAEPKYKADVPDSILTPDTVETRLGTLRFKDGAPDAETVKLAYDNLDFMRGVQAFLDGIPAASVYAMCKGFEGAGMDAQAFGIWETLMDARSLLLTQIRQPFTSPIASTSKTDRSCLRHRPACLDRWMTPISDTSSMWD